MGIMAQATGGCIAAQEAGKKRSAEITSLSPCNTDTPSLTRRNTGVSWRIAGECFLFFSTIEKRLQSTGLAVLLEATTSERVRIKIEAKKKKKETRHAPTT